MFSISEKHLRSNQIRRCLLLTLLSFWCWPTQASETEESKSAFLILNVSITEKRKQPTWVCLHKLGNCTHIPTNQALVKVIPGTYQVTHLDFRKSYISKSPHPDRGNHFRGHSINFTLEPGVIYFLGELKLKKQLGMPYELKVDKDIALLEKACSTYPSIFKKYPVSNLEENKKVNVNCWS